MSKNAIFVLLLLTVRGLAWGQGTCNITADQSPVIRGFRLGMTLDQVFRLVPEGRNDKKVLDALDQVNRERLPNKLTIQFNGTDSPYNKNPRFQNLNYIVLRFLNNQLTNLSVQYDWPTWENVNDFITKLRESFALPEAENWEGTSDSKRVICKDFTMVVRTPLKESGYISIDDSTSNKKMDDMRKAVLESARKEFKP